MCSISVAPMPSMILTPVASWNACQVGHGQVLAGGHAAPQASTSSGRRLAREHRPVRRRGGEADRHPVLRDVVGQLVRRRLLDQQRRGADAQREHHEAAEPERERQRRRAGEHVVGRRPQHVRGERVGVREHVAVEVHRRLGPAGRTRGERQQRDVVGGGLDGRRTRRPHAAQPAPEIVVPVPAVGDDRDACRGRRLRRSSRNRWSQSARSICGDLGTVLQLARPQQRHRRDHDRTRLAARRTSRRPATGCSGRAAARGCPARPRARRPARARPGWPSSSSSPYVHRSPAGESRHGRSAPCRSMVRSSSSARAVQPVGVLHVGKVERRAPATARPAAGCRGRTCRRAPTAELIWRLRVIGCSVFPARDDSQEPAISRARVVERGAIVLP